MFDTGEENFIEINGFSWEQAENEVKVRISSGLDGIGTLPKENVKVVYTPKGFDLRIIGLKGKNLRYYSNLKISKDEDTATE